MDTSGHNEDIKALEDENRQVHLENIALQTTIKSLRGTIESLQQNMKDREKLRETHDIHQLSAANDRLTQEKDSDMQSIQEKEQQIQNLEEHIRGLNQSMDRLSSQYDNIFENLQSVELDNINLQNKITQLEQDAKKPLARTNTELLDRQIKTLTDDLTTVGGALGCGEDASRENILRAIKTLQQSQAHLFEKINTFKKMKQDFDDIEKFADRLGEENAKLKKENEILRAIKQEAPQKKIDELNTQIETQQQTIQEQNNLLQQARRELSEKTNTLEIAEELQLDFDKKTDVLEKRISDQAKQLTQRENELKEELARLQTSRIESNKATLKAVIQLLNAGIQTQDTNTPSADKLSMINKETLLKNLSTQLGKINNSDELLKKDEITFKKDIAFDIKTYITNNQDALFTHKWTIKQLWQNLMILLTGAREWNDDNSFRPAPAPTRTEQKLADAIDIVTTRPRI